MADEERSRRRYRALADPSRARILTELGGGVLLDTRTLAARVGLHVNTVRVHLGVLEDAGLVEAETLPPQGRGRPRLAYRAAGEAADDGGRRYRLLAEILTTLVARSDNRSSRRLEETGELWGRHLVDSPPPFVELTDGEAIERLLRLLDETGFRPELETGDERRILMRSCPFLELARRHQEVVCPIHLGLMRGALAELGASTRAARLEPFVRGDLCVAHLSAGTAS